MKAARQASLVMKALFPPFSPDIFIMIRADLGAKSPEAWACATILFFPRDTHPPRIYIRLFSSFHLRVLNIFPSPFDCSSWGRLRRKGC